METLQIQKFTALIIKIEVLLSTQVDFLANLPKGKIKDEGSSLRHDITSGLASIAKKLKLYESNNDSSFITAARSESVNAITKIANRIGCYIIDLVNFDDRDVLSLTAMRAITAPDKKHAEIQWIRGLDDVTRLAVDASELLHKVKDFARERFTGESLDGRARER